MGTGPHGCWRELAPSLGGGKDGWRAMESPTAGVLLPAEAWLDFLPVIKDCSSF